MVAPRPWALGVGLLLAAAGSAAASSFRVPNSDCLMTECHSSGAVRASLNVDAQFDGIGRITTGAVVDALRSQHNIAYADDGNLSTIETAAVNECKKCHGDGLYHRYRRTGAWLAYPSAIGANAAGQAIPRPAGPNYSQYQDFCLSCHRGKVWGTTPAVEMFNGPVPPDPVGGAPQQVAPSSRSNPAALQTAAPWRVAAVPGKDANLASPHTNVDPDGTATRPYYLAYYETNGHGRATGIKAPTPMDVTCLANGVGPQGCHGPHGTKSRYLISDLFTSAPAPALVTAAQVSQSLCVNCHVPGLAIVGFHSLAPHYRPHVSSALALGYMAPFANVNLQDSGPITNLSVGRLATQPITTLLPFYADTNTVVADGNGARIEQRLYGSGTAVPALATPAAPNPPLSRDWIHCLTCHDPHGTSLLYQGTVEYGELGDRTPNTRGMLRKFPTIWLAPPVGSFTADALCGECHLYP